MTKEEKKEIIRVCGPNYEYQDIPTYIRNRDEKKEMEDAGSILSQMEDEMTDMFGEGGAEEVREFYEDEEFARRADLDAEREKEL